jgi:hypothetical protein
MDLTRWQLIDQLLRLPRAELDAVITEVGRCQTVEEKAADAFAAVFQASEAPLAGFFTSRSQEES